MDEIEFLVNETFKHLSENFKSEDELLATPVSSVSEIPAAPGVLYHIQKTSSIFVIRTLTSKNVRDDYEMIFGRPEDFPSLRLVDTSEKSLPERLRFFLVETEQQAEIIHDHLNNRRFPIDEEAMCNLSDPGFSWWLTKKDQGFQLSFTLSVSGAQESVKLGPLGDQQLALRSFQHLEEIVNEAGLELNVQNEMNRVQFTEGEEFMIEELKDLFEFGVVSDGLAKVFKLLSRHVADHLKFETTWLYLQELAAMRRFWIQVQYDLQA